MRASVRKSTGCLIKRFGNVVHQGGKKPAVVITSPRSKAARLVMLNMRKAPWEEKLAKRENSTDSIPKMLNSFIY